MVTQTCVNIGLSNVFEYTSLLPEQWSLTSTGTPWYSSEGNFTRSLHELNLENVFILHFLNVYYIAKGL